MSKEAKARIKINKLLENAGWRFFDDEIGQANILLENNVKLTKTVLDNYGNDSMYFWFIVKSANTGINTKILYVASVNTWQAYNHFDGYDENGNLITKNLYYGPDGSYETRARQVSFNRPFTYTGFDYFEIPFIRWFYKAKANGKFQDPNIELEFCTSVDLQDPNFNPNFYKLILSVGHDEYWSWEMRDTIENFVAAGGNVAFFSGNVCWWQVRLDDDEQGNHFRTLKCYKEIQQPDGTYSPGEDPYLTDPDPQIRRHTSCNWFDILTQRPENLMTGVSYYWGSAILPGYTTTYKLLLYKHWLLKGGINLTFGHTFGGNLFSGMFETDAADFEDNDRKFPVPTGRNAYGYAAPKDLVILASADLSHLGDNYQDPNFGYWSGPNYHNGWGTIGIFRNPAAVTNGFVFHGSNYNWASQGLGEYVNSNNWNEFCLLTKNVFEILSIDFQPQSFLLDNSDFELGNLTGWNQTGNGIFSIISPGYSSSNCVKIDASNAGGITYLSQKYVPIRTNRPYKIRCFAKPDNGVLSSKSITIHLETLDVNNKPVKEFITAAYPISGTDWQEISAEGSLVLSNNADIMVQVRVKVQVDNNQSAYFDNVIVEEMP